jgi:hypothetical protein
MSKKQIYLLCLLSSLLSAEELISKVDENSSSRKGDTVQIAIEMGGKTNFWTPGIAGNVIDYKTEGLYLGFGKLKLKLYNNDVFTVEKYATFSGTKKQNDLLAEYKDDRKHESSIDGIRVTLQLMKVINFLFDKEWLTGLNYEFDTRNFLGNAKLLQTSKRWFGRIEGGVDGEDYNRIEEGTNLAFKTKFTSHKLSYQFEDVINFTKGDYISVGLFDEEWSKPTFIGDSLLGEEPLVFDANYYTRGISSAVGVKTDNYSVETYLDYGADNKMDIIQKGDNYSRLNKDIKMYRVGAKGNYKFKDVYTTNFFTTDIIVGAEMQYNQLTQGGTIALDAETLYGVNAGIEVTF